MAGPELFVITEFDCSTLSFTFYNAQHKWITEVNLFCLTITGNFCYYNFSFFTDKITEESMRALVTKVGILSKTFFVVVSMTFGGNVVSTKNKRHFDKLWIWIEIIFSAVQSKNNKFIITILFWIMDYSKEWVFMGIIRWQFHQ